MTSNRHLLRDLRTDHRNMMLVLEILQTFATSAQAGDDPDFELAAEIMHYMTVYPDAVHHPNEDVLYAQLRDKRPDLADGLDDVSVDHREIGELGQRLREDVEAIVAGAAVRREAFIEDTERYVCRLRKHIQWEESDLFRRIERMLDENEDQAAGGETRTENDPIFRLGLKSSFPRLVSTLRDATH